MRERHWRGWKKRVRTIKTPPHIKKSKIDRKKLIEIIRRLHKEREEDGYEEHLRYGVFPGNLEDVK